MAMKLAVGIILIAAAGAGAFFKPWKSPEAAASGDSTWIAIEPKRRDLSSFVLATGIVRPRVGAEVEVGSRVSGILAKLGWPAG